MFTSRLHISTTGPSLPRLTLNLNLATAAPARVFNVPNDSIQTRLAARTFTTAIPVGAACSFGVVLVTVARNYAEEKDASERKYDRKAQDDPYAS